MVMGYNNRLQRDLSCPPPRVVGMLMYPLLFPGPVRTLTRLMESSRSRVVMLLERRAARAIWGAKTKQCLLCISPNADDVISFTTNRMMKAFRRLSLTPKTNSLCKWASLAATQPNFPQWGNKMKWVCGSDVHGNWTSRNKGKRSLIRTMILTKSEKPVRVLAHVQSKVELAYLQSGALDRNLRVCEHTVLYGNREYIQ